MVLLDVQNATAGYGVGPNILNDLSLRIEEGRTYCIIGPNGAGKSTLLRLICGLLTPRSGRVVFKGETLNGLRADQILGKGICFVPQDQSLFGDMTVRENLRLGGYILDDRREVERRVEDAFRMFPILEERASQPARTLSGGEQQMLAIARGLVLRPTIIMLDEPSLGLAPKVSKQIYDNMEQLKHVGVAVILVEQNARMGLKFADWGVVLDLGRTLFEGPSNTVLEDPRIQELYLGRLKTKPPETVG